MPRRPVALTSLLLLVLAGCGSAASTPVPSTPASSGTPVATTPAPATDTAPTGAPRATASPAAGSQATPAPRWLGTRILPRGPGGFAAGRRTPTSLAPRDIVTEDLLPPPADGKFHARIERVPSAVAKRSTWSSACPVRLSRLRYVTVGFRGFDGRAHTGELLVNASAAAGLVRVFHHLFSRGWPIEQMRIASKADLHAPPTGDGNVTGDFACRPVRGGTGWSQHAYGLAVDLDPFQNPYVDGARVLPELATAYARRGREWPGIIRPGAVPVRAFAAIGWGWGGNYRSKKDWMHFSATGG